MTARIRKRRFGVAFLMPTTAPERRPDPDALLARVKEDESRAQRGRLRIFFGATAGVGKS